MVLLDVNILVHAWRPAADRHAEYRRWLESTVFSDQSFGVSELVLSGFLRVVTNPGMWGKGHDAEAAFDFVGRLRERANCVIFAPGARHWSIFLDLCRKSDARGNLISDAYHAALAIEHGCEWITADRHFARFPGLRWRHPLN